MKNERGDPLETKKFSRKSRTVPKKIEKGDSLAPSGFVGYLEKVKNERGDPLHEVCLGPFGGLGALGNFRIVSKKWIDQCEDCSLKKKKLKIEKKNFRIFFEFFFEVSGKSHNAENIKGGTLFLMLDALDALKMKY